MTFQLGTISEGTLRPEDLAPIFIDYLVEHGVDYGDIPEDLDGLFDAMQEICPPFVYFGAHPGDAADFGFWPDIQDLNDALAWHNPDVETCDDVDCRFIDGEHAEVFVHVNDHGNVTVYDSDHEELWSCV